MLAVWAAASGQSLASETGFSGLITLTSEYIYRGQALSDGNPALQAGLDYQHSSGWFAGAWASTVDLRSPFGRRDLELDYYLGYSHVFNVPLAVSATLIRYTYPGQTGSFDYDHNQWVVAATLRERLAFEFGYSDDIYGWNRIGRHVEVRAEQPFANAWVVSGGLGRNDLESLRAGKYLYWDVGVSARQALTEVPASPWLPRSNAIISSRGKPGRMATSSAAMPETCAADSELPDA